MTSVMSDVRFVVSSGCKSSMHRLSKNAASTARHTPFFPRTSGHRNPSGTVITTFSASCRAAFP